MGWLCRFCNGEQLARAGDVVGAGAAGEQAVVADAVEALRQDVDQEAADELVGGERHDLLAIATLDAIVLPSEGDAVRRRRRSAGCWRWRRGGYSATDRPARLGTDPTEKQELLDIADGWLTLPQAPAIVLALGQLAILRYSRRTGVDGMPGFEEKP